jgi:hypothetical protein
MPSATFAHSAQSNVGGGNDLSRDLPGWFRSSRYDVGRTNGVVKIPNLLCDLLIANVVFLATRRRFAFLMAMTVLCLYWFNPAMTWEGGFVGQIEAVQTLPIVLQ